MPEQLQHGGDQSPDQLIVFHQKDNQAASIWCVFVPQAMSIELMACFQPFLLYGLLHARAFAFGLQVRAGLMIGKRGH
jgi:hypothetical protein